MFLCDYPKQSGQVVVQISKWNMIIADLLKFKTAKYKT
jgi:hypothetical protein